MVFGEGKHTLENYHIYVNNVKIEKLSSTKFLDVL